MVTPYLTFYGSCKDALDFYREIFHCDKPKVLPYGDYMPEGSKTPPEFLRTWVMHAEMVICGTNCILYRRNRFIYKIIADFQEKSEIALVSHLETAVLMSRKD